MDKSREKYSRLVFREFRAYMTRKSIINICARAHLMDARIYGKEVILITRSPGAKNDFYTARVESYHKTLLGAGVKIIYNNAVQAKMIVLDRAVAIVSSMNFYSSSIAGVSWEAGIVTIDDTVVESITNAILGLLEKQDSIQRK